MDISEARYVLDKFIDSSGVNIEILGQPHKDIDSNLFHIKAGEQEYYLAKADYLEEDEYYKGVATSDNLGKLERVKIKNQFIPEDFETTLHPSVVTLIPHGSIEEERVYVYGEPRSIWRYKLFKIYTKS